MNNKTRSLVYVSMFAALTSVGAYIRVPVPYVPFTLQFLFCALAGMILGSKLGALSQIVYVVIGLLGVPVFTEGGGPGYIVKPTFGYLIGFIVAAYVIGKVTEKIKKINFINAFGTTILGLFFVYLFGVVHLYLIYNLYLGSYKSFYWALFYGCIVCVGGDIVLSGIVALIGIKLIPAVRHIQQNN